MPPKKDEAALISDLRAHMQWVEQNMEMLQSQDGVGLRGRLRQGGGGKEAQLDVWLAHYAEKMQLHLCFPSHCVQWMRG